MFLHGWLAFSLGQVVLMSYVTGNLKSLVKVILMTNICIILVYILSCSYSMIILGALSLLFNFKAAVHDDAFRER